MEKENQRRGEICIPCWINHWIIFSGGHAPILSIKMCLDFVFVFVFVIVSCALCTAIYIEAAAKRMAKQNRWHFLEILEAVESGQSRAEQSRTDGWMIRVWRCRWGWWQTLSLFLIYSSALHPPALAPQRRYPAKTELIAQNAHFCSKCVSLGISRIVIVMVSNCKKSPPLKFKIHWPWVGTKLPGQLLLHIIFTVLTNFPSIP